MAIIITSYFLLFLVLAWRRIDWAVMLILATLPAYLIRFNIFGLPLTLLEGMILVSFFAWLFKHTKFTNFLKGKYKIKNFFENRKKRAPYPFGLELVLLLIVAFISAGISNFSDSALGIWKAYFFEPALLYILILNVFKFNGGKSQIKKIIWPFAISAFAISFLAIYQKITGQFIYNEMWAVEEARRVVSFFGYPNAVGLYLAPLILIFIAYVFQKSLKAENQDLNEPQNSKFKIQNLPWANITLISISVLSFLAVYFAKSKGAMFGLGAGLILFGLAANKKFRIAVVALLIVGSLSFLSSTVRVNFSENIKLKNLSGEIRKQQWRETWEMLSENKFRFIFGSGLANYQNAIKPYHQEGIFFNKNRDPDFRRKIVIFDENYKAEFWQPVEIYLYPHNIFLNFWTELGLIGIFLFIWIIIKFYCLGFKNLKLIQNFQKNRDKYIVLGLLASMTVIIVHGLVDVPYFKNDLSVMFWVLVAMMAILNLEFKNKN